MLDGRILAESKKALRYTLNPPVVFAKVPMNDLEIDLRKVPFLTLAVTNGAIQPPNSQVPTGFSQPSQFAPDPRPSTPGSPLPGGVGRVASPQGEKFGLQSSCQRWLYGD